MRLRTQLEGPLFAGMMLCVACLPQMAAAALGEPETAIAAEVQQLNGSIKSSTEHTNYRVHDIQLPSGTVLREFADREGKVFAVAWSGPTIPDLRQALGQYFERYVNGAKANHSGHRHLEIRQDDLVLQSSGHMRAFSGRAYLPQSLPPGTSPDEIR